MLKDKIESAKQILLEADSIAEDGFKFLLFSGGKDSLVVSDLARKTLGVKNGFNEQSIVPPYIQEEIRQIQNHIGLDVHYNTRLTPKRFVKHWKNQIPPKKWKPSDLDCVRHWKSIPEYAKKTNATMMIFGRRKEENTIPKPIYYKKNFKPLQVHPIWNWTFDEVWEYLHKNNIPYPSCYKDGSKHLYTWVSLAQMKYKETKNMYEVYETIYKHAPEYMHEMRGKDEQVDKYLSMKTNII